MSMANCRVVLVRTEVAGNLGATARAMANFGASDLVLVAPAASPTDPEALRRSARGEAVLRNARRVERLEEALADCHYVVATTARVGGRFRKSEPLAPAAVTPRFAAAIGRGKCALVLGPEPSGLSNEDLAACHELVTIPTDDAYPALNLAQAAAILLYEARRAADSGSTLREIGPSIAAVEHQERMFAALRSGLEAVGYLRGENADALFVAIRSLVARSLPSAREVDLLFGLARQLEWFGRR